MFGFFKGREAESRAAQGLYRAVAAQSREPVFYALYGVPDTVDGRFDLVCLHAYLLIDRLYGEGRKGRRLAQALFDAMFSDMDGALREMGIGDLSVPRHMKRMMKGFNGRANAYRVAMAAEEPEALTDALARNLYGARGGAVDGDWLNIMALYMHESVLSLAAQPWDRLAAGEVSFKRIEYGNDENGSDTGRSAGMVA